MSLNDATEIARQRNAHIRQSEIDRKLAELDVLRRKLAYVDLKISVSADAGYQYPPEVTAADGAVVPEACPVSNQSCWQSTTQAGLHGTLSIPVWSGLTMEAKLSAARLRETSALAGEKSTVREIVLAVGQAYWEVRRMELQRETLQTLIGRFRELERLTQQKVGAGLAPALDFDRQHQQTLDLELQIIHMTAQVMEARAALASLLQIDEEIRLIEEPPNEVLGLPSLDEAVHIALKERPELAVSEANAEAAGQDLRAAKGAYWPQLSLYGQVDYVAGGPSQAGTQPGDATSAIQTGNSTASQPNSSSTTYFGGVQLRWNVFDMMTTWMDVKQAGLKRERVVAQKDRTRHDVIADVRRAHAQLDAALRARAPSRKLVEIARSTMQILWRAYTVGAKQMPEIIRGQEQLLRYELQLVDKSIDLAEGTLALKAAMGRL